MRSKKLLMLIPAFVACISFAMPVMAETPDVSSNTMEVFEETEELEAEADHISLKKTSEFGTDDAATKIKGDRETHQREWRNWTYNDSTRVMQIGWDYDTNGVSVAVNDPSRGNKLIKNYTIQIDQDITLLNLYLLDRQYDQDKSLVSVDAATADPYKSEYTLTITGDGTHKLTISGELSGRGTLIIGDGAKVEASSIPWFGSVVVNGGELVSKDYGINCGLLTHTYKKNGINTDAYDFGGDFTLNNGTVNSVVINAYRNFKVAGGNLTVNKKSDNNFYAIDAGDVLISGGSVTADGLRTHDTDSKNTNRFGAGYYWSMSESPWTTAGAQGEFSMTGGSLTLKKGANAALLVSKNINISGGTVNINADGAQADYVWGMRAQKDINITGGNVTVNSKSESITTWAEGDTSTVLNEFGVPTPDKKAGGSINISGENTSVKVSAPNTLGESAILAVGNKITIVSPLGFVNPQNGKIVTDNGNQYVVTPDYLVARDIEIAKGGTSVVYSDMPSSDPGNPSNNTVVDLGKIRSFVTRMYTQVLGRNPEDAGLNDWVKQLADKSNNGAGLAKGFILSTEFTQRNLSNEEYLKVLYKTFFDREPDEGGYNDWLSKLNSGVDRTVVLTGFVNSTEFQNLCDNYGISRGLMREDGSYMDTEKIKAFVERMYNKALARNGEQTGIDYWVDEITSGRWQAADVAKRGFYMSEEYTNRGRSNEEFVEDLYNGLFDRPSDDAGKADWLNRLANGASREEIMNGFGGSQEFANMLASFGL